MAAFPETPIPSKPYLWTPKFSTIIGGPYLSGSAVFRKGRLLPLHSVTLKWNYLEPGDAKTIYDFFIGQFGRFLPFTYFDLQGWDLTPVGVAWTGVYVGVGNGSTTTMDLPGKTCSSVTVKENGTTKAGTVLTGGGVDGCDRFTPTAAWTIGAIITVDFTGRRSYRNVHFDADEMPFSWFETILTSSGISMSEVA
jgi:hypothetical protein